MDGSAAGKMGLWRTVPTQPNRSPKYSTLRLGPLYLGAISPISPTTAQLAKAPTALLSASPLIDRRSAMRSVRTQSTSCSQPSTTLGCQPTSAAFSLPATDLRRRMADGRSAPVAINASAARTATSTPPTRPPTRSSPDGPGVSTSSKSSA